MSIFLNTKSLFFVTWGSKHKYYANKQDLYTLTTIYLFSTLIDVEFEQKKKPPLSTVTLWGMANFCSCHYVHRVDVAEVCSAFHSASR